MNKWLKISNYDQKHRKEKKWIYNYKLYETSASEVSFFLYVIFIIILVEEKCRFSFTRNNDKFFWIVKQSVASFNSNCLFKTKI